MTTIRGIEGMTDEEFLVELQRGGRFVVFEYCISALIISTKRSSPVYFIRVGEDTSRKILRYNLLTIFLGWWGIPWGPIYSFQALNCNSQGGRDVTAEVLAAMQASQSAPNINPTP